MHYDLCMREGTVEVVDIANGTIQLSDVETKVLYEFMRGSHGHKFQDVEIYMEHVQDRDAFIVRAVGRLYHKDGKHDDGVKTDKPEIALKRCGRATCDICGVTA